MNVLLRNLEDAGLVERPATAPSGRALPTRLTPAGERLLEAATADVLAIERRMTAALDPAQAKVLLDQLESMADALSADGRG